MEYNVSSRLITIAQNLGDCDRYVPMFTTPPFGSLLRSHQINSKKLQAYSARLYEQYDTYIALLTIPGEMAIDV